ncbi:MAG TPA: aldo/keto reductase [Candidatus Dormibacteraeota bacterium]|jgi:aryl-alcohol dehydrogenase-like predicted oxidoreductase|nr:aldo/keto reductase [Candidatus Dormibacteraeota bacterium]
MTAQTTQVGLQRTRLGRSELNVSRIAFGTWQLGGDWGATDEEAAILAIRHAYERGINFFDTAQGYGFGASEQLLAKALRGYPRESVVIATKGGLRPLGGPRVERDSSAAWIRQGVDDSLRALATDHVDLLQVHWPDPRTPFSETAGALAELVAAGKVRHVGVSNFSPEQMDEFSKALPVETVQPPYHLFHRDIEAGLLPYTQAHDIGVLVYGPMAHGLLSGHLGVDTHFASDDWRSHSPDFQGDALASNVRVVAALEQFARDELGVPVSRLAVAWTLANPAVQVAIIGTRNAEHVDDAVAAAGLALSADVLRRIDDIVSGAVRIAGPRPEAM